MAKYEFDSISDLCDFYEEAGFSKEKINAILDADDRGIEISQIQIVAKPGLTIEQMNAFFASAEAGIISDDALEAGVKKAIENNLDPDSIEKYCLLIERGNSIDNALNRCAGEFIGVKELDPEPMELPGANKRYEQELEMV